MMNMTNLIKSFDWINKFEINSVQMFLKNNFIKSFVIIRRI